MCLSNHRNVRMKINVETTLRYIVTLTTDIDVSCELLVILTHRAYIANDLETCYIAQQFHTL